MSKLSDEMKASLKAMDAEAQKEAHAILSSNVAKNVGVFTAHHVGYIVVYVLGLATMLLFR